MKRKWTYLVPALAVVLALVSGTGCKKLRARDDLNKGVQAFKSARYSDAVDKFKEAIELDPTFPTARLYLAIAYFQQWIPGSDEPDNAKMLEAAKDQFNQVLQDDPKNAIAIEYLAQLNYSETQGIKDLDKKTAKFDEAKEWYQKLSDLDPKNKTALYSLGVIAWAKWYPTLSVARSKAGMKPEDPGPLKDKKAREELRGRYWDMINAGIADLNRALDIDPNYDDAMAYLNLLYRERADLAATPEDYKADIAQADSWMQKTLDTRKKKAGMTADVTPASAGSQ
ncbi:MAG: tetratricopeptide repeat protein [Bryobacteraceae bacterium]|jgi:tetratricopeptide (TPR) repeat protein